MNIQLILLSIISIIFFSCEESETNIVQSLEEISQCHSETTWTTTSINNALIGEWQWEYMSCYWTPEEANGEDYHGLSIEFIEDNTLIIKDNGQIIQTAEWKIIEINNSYKISVSPEVNQIYGKM